MPSTFPSLPFFIFLHCPIFLLAARPHAHTEPYAVFFLFFFLFFFPLLILPVHFAFWPDTLGQSASQATGNSPAVPDHPGLRTKSLKLAAPGQSELISGLHLVNAGI